MYKIYIFFLSSLELLSNHQVSSSEAWGQSELVNKETTKVKSLVFYSPDWTKWLTGALLLSMKAPPLSRTSWASPAFAKCPWVWMMMDRARSGWGSHQRMPLRTWSSSSHWTSLRSPRRGSPPPPSSGATAAPCGTAGTRCSQPFCLPRGSFQKMIIFSLEPPFNRFTVT